MIESFIDGRIRVRDPRLKDPEQAAFYRQLLQQVDGVKEVSVNPKTGSLLALYDPSCLARADIEELGRQAGFFDDSAPLLPAVSPESKEVSSSRHGHGKVKFTREQRAFVRYGLLASLVVTTAFAYTNAPAHRITALAFLGFAAAHLMMYRKTFLR